MSKDLGVKKRMMFIMGEDYNFLAYNIFIILNGLGCISGRSFLKDHRKLSFLIDFVSDSKLLDVLEKQIRNYNASLNEYDKDVLNQSFTNSVLRMKTINQLIYTLNNEELIQVEEKKLEVLNVTLVKQAVDSGFFRGGTFKIERDNLKRLKSLVPRISILDISNLLSQLYYKHGVIDEQIIN
ncbi:hypothetical protein [Flagellimonas marina]|uniref:Uncharacterized protein n=1 Tax=Flagellimonas marina TaxID=1775168 RepID=A0ABV8PIV1_9FLAO